MDRMLINTPEAARSETRKHTVKPKEKPFKNTIARINGIPIMVNPRNHMAMMFSPGSRMNP